MPFINDSNAASGSSASVLGIPFCARALAASLPVRLGLCGFLKEDFFLSASCSALSLYQGATSSLSSSANKSSAVNSLIGNCVESTSL